MCAIVGIYYRRPINNPKLLLRMRDTMIHRGPNNAGVWWSADKRLGLAHRRLPIIDLSPSAHQPMIDRTGRYVIIFNGEIYNHCILRSKLRKSGHTFFSRSDTEVLLESYKEWGNNCVDHLTGSFAFAIYNGNRQELFIARDRAGEKPLYYKHDKYRFIFSSELKAMMADPMFTRQINLDELDHYLTYGHTSADKTIIKETYKLPPGHAMVYKLTNGNINIWRFWKLPKYVAEPSITTEELLQEMERLLSNAISNQLVSDVPIGILLSGGLDSSLITAIASEVSDQPIKTFNITLPEYKSYNEGPYAKLVADYFGTDHTELVAEPTTVSILPKLARQFDEPLADHSIVPMSLVANIARTAVTVVLGGDGGDELFGGYPHYNFLVSIERMRKTIPEGFRKFSSAAASYILPVGTKGRNHLIGIEGNTAASISAVNVYFDKYFRRKLLSPLYRSGYEPLLSPESKKATYVEKPLSILQNAFRTDFQTTLTEDYLVKSDRASMLHSLELRAPFLDHALIEFAFRRLPDNLRATANNRKILLKKLAHRRLPKELDINRKQGFTLPLSAWFKGNWGAFIIEVLSAADPTLFDKKTIHRLIQAQKFGLENTNRLFALTMFELWRREYNVSI